MVGYILGNGINKLRICVNLIVQFRHEKTHLNNKNTKRNNF